MWSIELADVGDGLCSTLMTRDWGTILLDWGSIGDPQAAISGWRRIQPWKGLSRNPIYPFSLIISHYHTDHYNGLIEASHQPHSFSEFEDLSDVFSPGLPSFERSAEFYLALFTLGARTLGSTTGHMDYDFLLAVARLKGDTHFEWTRLYRGDSFSTCGVPFQCLWPPRNIHEKRFSSVVERALKLFNEALQQDEVLSELQDKIAGSDFFQTLFDNSRNLMSLNVETILKQNEVWSEQYTQEIEISDVVRRTNKACQEAANYLCLAFRSGQEFLFLGDVKEGKISKIVKDLISEGALNFSVLLAPHHGTYWNKSLYGVRANNVLISNGARRWQNFNRSYSRIGGSVLCTYVTGDISVGF